jgi:hypothetical protein
MAPVELVGFTRCEAQRDIGVHRCRYAVTLPRTGIAPDGVVSAFIAAATEIFEDPDQCQPFPNGLDFIGLQQAVELCLPWADPWKRLRLTFIAKLRRLRAQDFANHLPGDPQLAADLLDRLLLDEIRTPDLRNSLHYQHPDPGLRSSRKPS